ncbi:MAG TPA: enoyl-CoA hydratase [Mycobacteriales bacterium]|nr:enoyl-CoA hydratase [Mycobacteriales bacterium]
MNDASLLLDVSARIATVTLNRPHKRNALDRVLAVEVPRVMAELGARTDVDAIILTGADPSFCAGLDLVDAIAPGGLLHGPPRPTELFAPVPMPVIGAINGATFTGGLELALACDWLIASEHATFADTHARVGVHPDGGLTVRLPQRVGVARARQMSATGERVDAHTALAWGLVNEVVAHEDLLPRCRALAAAVTKADRAALHRILATYRAHEEAHEADAFVREHAAVVHAAGDGYDGASVAARRDTLLHRDSGPPPTK